MDQLFNTQFNEYKHGWIDLFEHQGTVCCWAPTALC